MEKNRYLLKKFLNNISKLNFNNKAIVYNSLFKPVGPGEKSWKEKILTLENQNPSKSNLDASSYVSNCSSYNKLYAPFNSVATRYKPFRFKIFTLNPLVKKSKLPILAAPPTLL